MHMHEDNMTIYISAIMFISAKSVLRLGLCKAIWSCSNMYCTLCIHVILETNIRGSFNQIINLTRNSNSAIPIQHVQA